MSDMVNSPSHYADSEIECIDAMVAAFGTEAVQMYCRLASFKYQRCRRKLGYSSRCLRPKQNGRHLTSLLT